MIKAGNKWARRQVVDIYPKFYVSSHNLIVVSWSFCPFIPSFVPMMEQMMEQKTGGYLFISKIVDIVVNSNYINR